MSSFSITGNLVDVHLQKIYPAIVTVENGKIISVKAITSSDSGIYRGETPNSELLTTNYILPGFIDSHVHIESSMLVPSEFARLAVVHGTVGTVSDPHEIANVCGMEGVEFMIENGKTVPFKFNFGAPSCVPATAFETAGAELDASEVEKLLQRDDIKYLSEMMNFPGVLNGDPEVMKKIAAAHRLGKPVDGHAPGLKGEEAKRYIDGISAPLLPPSGGGLPEPENKTAVSTRATTTDSPESKVSPCGGPDSYRDRGATDHECFTAEEALDKLKYGMKIIIREGSAAKNFEALIGLLNDYPDQMMFCSDDKHPDSLVLGHINQLCARAVAKGITIFNVLKAACVNPVHHYKLDIGLLRTGDPADFIVARDLENFEVIKTYIGGELVAENGKSGIIRQKINPINHFSCSQKAESDFEVPWKGENKIPVIEALDGQLITNRLLLEPKVTEGKIVSDPERDILKIVVVNRYNNAAVAKAFIRNFGLKQGALASSVAHDSHNIVAVGMDDESITNAVNLLIAHKGGVSLVNEDLEMIVPLRVAGLMSDEDGYRIAEQYALIDKAAKEAGSTLGSPFMTLSFMALLVIPHLKLSDKGLFDGDRFAFIDG